jgi:hypothetical protein
VQYGGFEAPAIQAVPGRSEAPGCHRGTFDAVDGPVAFVGVSERFPSQLSVAAAVTFAVAIGCHGGPNAVFTEIIEARRLAAEVRVGFNKASDASNRAVMADTDAASVAFVREAEQSRDFVKTTIAALEPRLRRLGYATEISALEEFRNHFAEYEKLDRSILELAVENTNLKAQRLSFGPARQEADIFRDALGAISSNTTSKDRCRVESLVGKAVVAVREIQVLQAPHIAESDDSRMTDMEREMAVLEATARDALSALSQLIDPKARPRTAAAAAALDRFAAISKELVKLSRRNSNVRSLELSLRPKPALTAACDDRLRVLLDALGNEKFAATR